MSYAARIICTGRSTKLRHKLFIFIHQITNLKKMYIKILNDKLVKKACYFGLVCQNMSTKGSELVDKVCISNHDKPHLCPISKTIWELAIKMQIAWIWNRPTSNHSHFETAKFMVYLVCPTLVHTLVVYRTQLLISAKKKPICIYI